jgi:GTP cyclohydrolase I
MKKENNYKIYELAALFSGPGIDEKQIESAIRQILAAVGEDTERQGLQRTPERVAQMYGELLEGYRIDPL